MGTLFFPADTVLVNFALLHAFDLLERLLAGRSSWTATVAEVCTRESQATGLEQLERAEGFFGEPLFVETTQEYTDASSLRARMSRPGAPPTAHLGEAEALSIIGSRELDAVLITDDFDARAVARLLGVRTSSTCDLLRLAVRARMIPAAGAFAGVVLLRRKQRRLLDSPASLNDYVAWCTAA